MPTSTKKPVSATSFPGQFEAIEMVGKANNQTAQIAPGTTLSDNPYQLPPIIIRTARGEIIDTFSSYQRQIYSTKARLQAGYPANRPEEWRLLPGFIPSKPDYSRFVRVNELISGQAMVTEAPGVRSWLASRVRLPVRRLVRSSSADFLDAINEVSQDDLGERYCPSRHSQDDLDLYLSTVRRKYPSREQAFPSAQTAWSHISQLHRFDYDSARQTKQPLRLPLFTSGTGQLTSQAVPPGLSKLPASKFTPTARKPLLCYGCAQSSSPHFHHDKQMRTGGGFTYFKKGGPISEDEARNPMRWRHNTSIEQSFFRELTKLEKPPQTFRNMQFASLFGIEEPPERVKTAEIPRWLFVDHAHRTSARVYGMTNGLNTSLGATLNRAPDGYQSTHRIFSINKFDKLIKKMLVPQSSMLSFPLSPTNVTDSQPSPDKQIASPERSSPYKKLLESSFIKSKQSTVADSRLNEENEVPETEDAQAARELRERLEHQAFLTQEIKRQDELINEIQSQQSILKQSSEAGLSELERQTLQSFEEQLEQELSERKTIINELQSQASTNKEDIMRVLSRATTRTKQPQTTEQMSHYESADDIQALDDQSRDSVTIDESIKSQPIPEATAEEVPGVEIQNTEVIDGSGDLLNNNEIMVSSVMDTGEEIIATLGENDEIRPITTATSRSSRRSKRSRVSFNTPDAPEQTKAPPVSAAEPAKLEQTIRQDLPVSREDTGPIVENLPEAAEPIDNVDRNTPKATERISATPTDAIETAPKQTPPPAPKQTPPPAPSAQKSDLEQQYKDLVNTLPDDLKEVLTEEVKDESAEVSPEDVEEKPKKKLHEDFSTSSSPIFSCHHVISIDDSSTRHASISSDPTQLSSDRLRLNEVLGVSNVPLDKVKRHRVFYYHKKKAIPTLPSFQAPPPFKLKRTQKKITLAKDPFSTDRHYDIPEAKPIVIEKSDKPLTKTEEFFQNREVDYEVPEAFVPKKSDKALTEFIPPRERTPPKPRKSGADDLPALPSLVKKQSKMKIPVPKTPSPPPPPIPEPEPPEPPKVEEVPEPEPPKLPAVPQTTGVKRRSVVPFKKPQKRKPKKKKKTVVHAVEEPPPVERTPTPELPIIDLPASLRTPPKEETPPPEPTPTPSPPPTPTPPPPPKREPTPPKTPPTLPEVSQTPDLEFEFELPAPDDDENENAEEQKEEEEVKKRPPPPDLKYLRYKARKIPPKRPLRKIPKPTPIPKVPSQVFNDPLDYLAKWCIIHPTRLPYYEHVFQQALIGQVDKYAHVPSAMEIDEIRAAKAMEATLAGDTDSGYGSEAGERRQNRLQELRILDRQVLDNNGPGMSVLDSASDKLSFILSLVRDRHRMLRDEQIERQNDRIRLLASMLRYEYPNLIIEDAKLKAKKSKKTPATSTSPTQVKFPGDPANSSPDNTQQPLCQTDESQLISKAEKSVSDNLLVQNRAEIAQRLRMHREPHAFQTDEEIVANMGKKTYEFLSRDNRVKTANMMLERANQKLQAVTKRLRSVEDETLVMQARARENFTNLPSNTERPDSYRRRQSILYNKVNPMPDVELNLNLVEEALQLINGHLMTEKELQFIYQILRLPGRTRINFKLFSVIAALSEKVAQLDPIIRQLINKMDFNALDWKLEKCQEIFFLLDEVENGSKQSQQALSEEDRNQLLDSFANEGKVTARALAVELLAGGVTEEHVAFAMEKFNRENDGYVEYLDFLTYVPLFLELHCRIVNDPLDNSRVL